MEFAIIKCTRVLSIGVNDKNRVLSFDFVFKNEERKDKEIMIYVQINCNHAAD